MVCLYYSEESFKSSIYTALRKCYFDDDSGQSCPYYIANSEDMNKLEKSIVSALESNCNEALARDTGKCFRNYLEIYFLYSYTRR